MSRKLSEPQRRVLRSIHTGSGPMLWGDGRNSTHAASAFHRSADSLIAAGLAMHAGHVYQATGYHCLLTEEGREALFAEPTWRRFTVLRDAQVKLERVDVDALEDRIEAALNTHGASAQHLTWAMETLCGEYTVRQLQALAKAYGARSVRLREPLIASISATLFLAWNTPLAAAG